MTSSLYTDETFFPVGVAATIPFAMLDQLLPQTIDYMKIDIEGAEFNILAPTEGHNVLLNGTRFLDIEVHLRDSSYTGIKTAAGLCSAYEVDTPAEIPQALIDGLQGVGFKDLAITPDPKPNFHVASRNYEHP